MPEICPNCGTPLEPNRPPDAGCPTCLLNLALSADPDGFEAGARVGPYTVRRKLGEGGMGVVYLADQEAPIQRRVALKVIKHGMDTRSVVARFEAERQALAMMDHPAVARVYEAGETETGRPYFAMEYIDGEPVTAYCDQHRLGTVERLRLFVRICEGLQHAHQRGIIHRDIKPSNVLVGERDGAPQPKIIDFGVAKAVEQPLHGQTALTALGVLLGTPEYMSPEQAELAPLEIDTRTDVYSLGVLLYELLTGALPFDASDLRSAAFDEVRRRIREVTPSKPSTRISELGEHASGAARSRRLDPAGLMRRLAGDLDLITMKALEKERDRRYGSPAELAADIGRHLAHEPVLAQPPSAAYLLRKLVAKHRVTASLLAALFVSLVGSSVALAVLYGRSQANLDRALAAEEESTQVSDFLVGVFAVSDPGEARGNSATARELLDGAAGRIDLELRDQPGVQTKLMNTMGEVYGSLGLYPRSEELLRDALDRRRDRFGDRSAEVAESRTALSRTLADAGRYDEAEEQARQAVAMRAELFGDDSLEVADSLEIQQWILWYLGRQDEALEQAQRVLAIREAKRPPDHDDIPQSLNNLGSIYLAMGKYDEAESVLLRATELRERHLDPNHPDLSASLNNLAELYRRQARYAEAEKLFLRIQAIDDRVLGPDHPQAALAHNNLGLVYRRMERYDDAIAQFREALRIREAALEPDHPLIAWTLDNLGLALRSKGDLAEAEQVTRRALEIARRSVGPEHGDTLIVMANLALIESDRGHLAEAERTFREVLALNRKIRQPEHPEIAFTLHNLGQVLVDQGRPEEAIEYFREALAISEATLGADHPDTVETREILEQLLAAKE